MIGHRHSTVRRRRNGERGAVLVEFALVGPVLFLMIIGLLDFSLIIAGNTAGTNGAREGARVGIVNFENADTAGSANYELVEEAVLERLAGLVRDDGVAINVRCLDGGASDLASSSATIPCTKARVVPGLDLIEVSFDWHHIGASPFVANGMHHERAMLVIQGEASYSTPLVTSTTSTSAPPETTTTTLDPFAATTTTDPSVSTTTTLAPTTTTTAPIPCKIETVTFSRNQTLRIWAKGSHKGSVRGEPLGVSVSAPGCAANQVFLQIPGAPVPYGAGVPMDQCVCGTFSYVIGGSNWSTGAYTIKITATTNSKSYSLTVYS